jgi:HK97 family phage portal protein
VIKIKWFKKKEETRMTLEEFLLSSAILPDDITLEQALNIPTVLACVEMISKTIAMLPVKLYSELDGKVTEIKDNRVDLLNDDTGDTLDGYQFKKAMVTDYLLEGASYAYINRERNKIKSLHYIEHRHVSVVVNLDPIFKSHDIRINAEPYRDFEFIKLIRNTKDGVTGRGIIKENQKILSVAYNTLVYENNLVKTGGNKRGFLKSAKKLTETAMDALKLAWKNLYGDTDENMIILNEGMEFQEASNTSVEMQLNENKKSNAMEICKLFNVPYRMLEGGATEEDNNNYTKNCILPILKANETALNKELLLSKEKGSFYFATDTKEFMKGDLLKRYQAYEIAIKNGFLQWDEVRYAEDYEPYDLNFIKLGLQDVLFNPTTKEIYTPNTDKTNNIDNPTKGGE